MSQERTEAIVLRGVDFSESSRIVTFLTPRRGRMACMAKGVKRPKSAMGSLLDTFNRLELIYYWKDNRQVQLLAEASLLDGYADLKSDLDKSAYGALPLELALKAAHENEPSDELFDELVRGIEQLRLWRGEAEAHVCWQVIHLLSRAGFAPVLDRCWKCGAEVAKSPGFCYDGGVVCRNCSGDRRLAQCEHEALKAMLESPMECPAVGETGDALGAMGRFAERHLETNLRSLRVIEAIYGNG